MPQRKERATTPAIWRPPSLDLPAELAGAVRAPQVTDRDDPAWQTPPLDWEGDSAAEYACYWWLKYHKRYREGIDFTMQTKVTAEGINRSNTTAVDFLLPIGLDHPASAPGDFDAVVWDPLTNYTHPDLYDDLAKRVALANQRKHLVFIDGAAVLASPFAILELALVGVDISGRGQG